MRILIDPKAGPCPGVKRAIRMVERQLKENDNLVALGPVIHNQKEVDRLTSLGLKSAPQPVDAREVSFRAGQCLFIRTHGITPELHERLRQLEIQTIDGTCPTVKKVQDAIAEYAKRDYRIIIVGKSTHPEVIGLLGYCGGKGQVISTLQECEGISAGQKTLLIAQTTVEREKFNDIAEKLSSILDDVVVIDSTCRQINKRHQDMIDFARSVDVLLLVGGHDSSNTGVLFEICKKENSHSHRIESVGDIKTEWFQPDITVGITGSASTPLWQLEEVHSFLQSLPMGSNYLKRRTT